MTEQLSDIMRGFPPPPEQRVTLENWDSAPFNRWSFRNIRRILPTAEVSRGSGPSSSLPRAPQALDSVTFQDLDGGTKTLADLLAETYSDGFLVLHRGRVVFERYLNGMTERSLHLSQSVAKSVVSSTAGILIGRGALDPEAPVQSYVPELARCGYKDATLQQVLDMTSGVRFTEDYTDPSSDVHLIDGACGWKPGRHGDAPTCVYELILTLDRERPHGESFRYRSIETEVLAWCLERATGLHLTELVGAELWGKLGAEQDASFTVDPAGAALASGGFNATLRDYARFAQMHLEQGLFNGRQIVAAEWIAGCRNGDHSLFGAPYNEVLPDGAYCNQFWIEDRTRRAYMARGVFGQLIYIDPQAALAAVKLSTWPDFQNARFSIETLRALRAIGDALGGA